MLILLSNLLPMYFFSLIEFITSFFHFLQTIYSTIIFVIMELVDVYGLFLVFFLFTNFTLSYYNLFFNIFFLTKNSSLGLVSPITTTLAPVSTSNKFVYFSSTPKVFQKNVLKSTNTLLKELFN